jgi:hypothetical protein
VVLSFVWSSGMGSLALRLQFDDRRTPSASVTVESSENLVNWTLSTHST